MEGCAIQKLIYENLHGETAVFFHAPWVLGRVKGVGMSDVKVVAAEGAYQQGESITGLRTAWGSGAPARRTSPPAGSPPPAGTGAL